MDAVMMAEILATVFGAVSVTNYAIFRYYNGKVKDLREQLHEVIEKFDALDEKLDKIIKEYEERISKLESDVRWLKNRR